MLDKNGVEIKTGDIVVISGAYFKNDNGHWVVTNSPGDKHWLGSDHVLCKCNAAGKPSTAKYRHGFWPIMITVSDRWKRAAAKEHNAAHATIEIVGHREVPGYEL